MDRQIGGQKQAYLVKWQITRKQELTAWVVGRRPGSRATSRPWTRAGTGVSSSSTAPWNHQESSINITFICLPISVIWAYKHTMLDIVCLYVFLKMRHHAQISILCLLYPPAIRGCPKLCYRYAVFSFQSSTRSLQWPSVLLWLWPPTSNSACLTVSYDDYFSSPTVCRLPMSLLRLLSLKESPNISLLKCV